MMMENFYKVVLVRPKKSFFRNPEHWMSVLAFAVVLTTYIVNDGLRDRAKDLADSLDAGYRAWSDHLALIRSDQLLSYVARGTQDTCATVHKSAKPCSQWMTTQDILTLNANPHAEALERERSYFLYTLSLANKIPYNQDLDEKHWAITKTLVLDTYYVNLQAQMDAYSKANMLDLATQVHKNAEWLRKALNDNSATLEKDFGFKSTFVDIPEIQLGRAMNIYSQAVIEQVRSQYEKAKHREERWKDAGFVLYPLGLVIALLGHFIKGDDDLELDAS